MKSKFCRGRLVAVILCLVISGQLKAQEIEEIKHQYPDEKAVMLKKVLEYNISIKNDVPDVESHETQQIAFLTSNAALYNGTYGFSHSDFRQLIAYEAHTQTANKKIFKVSDFKTSSDKESFVFYDDVKETTFNFPAVEPGSVGNLEVSWHDKDPHLLSSYYFEGGIPNINSELKLTVSNDVALKYYKMGLDTNNILVNIDKGRRNSIYTFTYKNCPADKAYNDAPGYAWYSPHVVFCIEKYKNKAGNVVSYLSNTDDLYHLNYSFIKTINSQISPALKRITDSLVAKVTSPEAKAKKIYSWVQHNIKYVAFENGLEGFVPRDAGLVCSRRFGDCKDMASILTEMMRAAGITAHFTWIGTRDKPYAFTQIPMPLVSNHMICTIELNGKYVFIDGTDPTCTFGNPPAAIQDKEAMVAINDTAYKILKVPVIDKSQNTIADTTWLELTADGIKGEITKKMHGYFATDMHGKLMYWKQKDMHEHVKDMLERGSNKFQLDTFNIKKVSNNNEFALSAKFTLPDYAKKIGDEYYLNLNLLRLFENEKIDYPNRKVPVEYNFKSTRKYVTILKLPAGYKLTYLPQSKTYHNNVWGFDLKYEEKNGSVILTQNFDNDNLMINYNQFEQWNKVLENLLPMYKETLSFSKI